MLSPPCVRSRWVLHTNSSLQHLNHPLIYKHPDQCFNDSFPLSETGLASSNQNQNEVCSDERGPAELEEWHGIQDTTPEVAASGTESHTDPSSDHRQLPVKPPAGMSELYSPTHYVRFESYSRKFALLATSPQGGTRNPQGRQQRKADSPAKGFAQQVILVRPQILGKKGAYPLV